MSNIPKEIWIAAASAILGALASLYIPKILTADDVALEYAPFYKEKFINVPNLLDGRVKISVDGNLQDNLSIMDIYLFNRSYKDLKDIPVTFEFYNEDQSTLPKLLGKQLKTPETFPKDSVTEIPQTDDGHVRFKISSLPVAAKYDTDFIASFVFLGKNLPKVRVQSDYADNKVISIYEYDKAKRERKEILQLFSIFISAMALFLAWLLWDSKRSKAKFLERLGDAAENIEGIAIPKEQLRKIAIESYTKVTNKAKPASKKQ